MRFESNRAIRRELRAVGASAAEANELLQVRDKLRLLRDDAPKPSIPKPRRRLSFGLLPVSAVAVCALMIGMTVAAWAQGSLPGAWLYPVKRATENTAVLLHPAYRANIMMRRADEVRQLVVSNADEKTVGATLSDYKSEAAAFKGTNYPAFEYCKANLERAETHATPDEKQQIAIVLKSLGDID